MARVKLRVLEEYLQELDVFENPKISLEQYVTQPHIASHLLHVAQTTFSDVEGCSVADLGCGCGALTLGSAVLGAAYTVGFEIDPDAVKVFRKNAKKLGLSGQWSSTSHKRMGSEKNETVSPPEDENLDNSDENSEETSDDDSILLESEGEDCSLLTESAVDVVLCDVTSSEGLGSTNSRWYKSFDTVVMNPPFGTKNNHGADMAFLKSALRIARCAVYSLHKTSTRNYVLTKGREWGGKGTTAEVLAKLRFDLPKSYKFHNKKNVDVEVDFVRFDVSHVKEMECNFSNMSLNKR
ncbi:hypothetical protein J437_LFUL013362 [Ladona fulva]|uniref:Methyltransferase-like protein 5 n=1 Tax=Ladona fulva TaxID=123851 RepID=A0A8K0P3T7_LADFU|nr:hypothetical protein J437_LFUL013362 [Ladona fulva]